MIRELENYSFGDDMRSNIRKYLPLLLLMCAVGLTAYFFLFRNRPKIVIREQVGSAHALAFSPNNKILASSFENGTVIFWDPLTGKRLQVFLQTSSIINALEFAPDGKLIAIALDPNQEVERNANGTIASIQGSIGYGVRVELREVASGKLVRSLSDDSASIATIAWSPDGKLLATGNGVDPTKIWHVPTGSLIKTLETTATDLEFSRNGNLFAVAGNKGVNIWKTGDWKSSVCIEEDDVISISFSRNSEWLATGGHQGAAKVWTLPVARLHRVLTIPKVCASRVAFSPDGKSLAVARCVPASVFSAHWNDTEIVFWDIAFWRRIKPTYAEYGPISFLEYSPDSNTIATSGKDATIRIWNAVHK